jgi:glycerophosphoryl diester phosphodiesterase
VAPESTRAALREAARAGADMVELDVQMTRDGRLVVFHDARLERTTNGAGRLSAAAYATLARLDAGSWFHPCFAGERILLVSQVLRLLPRRMRINLELKPTRRRRALLERLTRLIRRTGSRRRLLISSTDPRLLPLARRQRLACGLIGSFRPDRSLTRAIRLGCAAWHPFHARLTPRRIARAHAAGVRVHAWTVNRPSVARLLLRWGVDGLITNDPERLLPLVRRRR